jgi:transcriptional regulator with XRE-family HTH domain
MEKIKLFFSPKWGQVLREMRKSKGMSERKVAESLGISHVSIQHWETGETPISQPILDSLLDCYGYTLLDFVAKLHR